MASHNVNNFDKFCNKFPDSIPMKQIVELALIGKVVLSYKIDSLTSFHDQLMQGLWKKSPNGCLYPLDNRLEELLYVELNENFKADTEKSLEKLRSFSVAYKVFDKMSEPISSTKQNQEVLCVDENVTVPENDRVQDSVVEIGGSANIDQQLECDVEVDDTLISEANKVQVVVHDFLENKMKCITDMSGIKEHEVDMCFLGELPQILESQCILAGDTQSHNVMEMSDETLQPASSLPLVLPTHTMQTKTDYFVASDHASAPECPMYENRMLAKLRAFDGYNFHNLLLIGANEERFSTLGSLFVSNLFVSWKSLVSVPFLMFAPIQNDSLPWECGIMISCCGIGVTKPILSYTVTLEDKRVFRGEEDGIYMRDSWELIMNEISCHNCLLSRIDESMVILTYTFDPGGLTWDGCKAIITWSDFVYSRTNLSTFLDRRYERGEEYHEMEAQMKVFDPGLVFMNKGRLLRYNGFEDQLSMANVFCVGEYFYKIPSTRYHYHANYSNMLLAFGVNDHDGPVLIFDPGGNGDFLRVIRGGIDVNYRGLQVVARPDLKVRFEDDGCVVSRYLQPRGPIDALNKIIHAEGVLELWRRLFPNVKRVLLVNMGVLACGAHTKFLGIKSQMADVKARTVNQASNEEGERVHSHVRNDKSEMGFILVLGLLLTHSR